MGGFHTSRSRISMGPPTPRQGLLPDYKRHPGNAAEWPRNLGHSYFLQSRRPACGNDWVYTLDLAWDQEHARVEAIRLAKLAREKAAADKEFERRREELARLAEAPVMNAELEVIDWLIKSYSVTAKMEMDMEKIAKFNDEQEQKRTIEKEKKEAAKAVEDARAANLKRMEEEKKEKARKQKEKEKKNAEEVANMKASFGM